MAVGKGVTEIQDSEDEPLTSSPQIVSDEAVDKLSPAAREPSQDAYQDAPCKHQASGAHVANAALEHDQRLNVDHENVLFDLESSKDQQINLQLNDHKQESEHVISSPSAGDICNASRAATSNKISIDEANRAIPPLSPLAEAGLGQPVSIEYDQSLRPTAAREESMQSPEWKKKVDEVVGETDGSSFQRTEPAVQRQALAGKNSPAVSLSVCSNGGSKESAQGEHPSRDSEHATNAVAKPICPPAPDRPSEIGLRELIHTTNALASENWTVPQHQTGLDAEGLPQFTPTNNAASEDSQVEEAYKHNETSEANSRLKAHPQGPTNSLDTKALEVPKCEEDHTGDKAQPQDASQVLSVGNGSMNSSVATVATQGSGEEPKPTQSPSNSTDQKRSAPARTLQENTLAELKAQRAALMASLAALPEIQNLIDDGESSETASQSSAAEPTEAEITAAANKIVKKHIKLLHEYNEIKDVGQGLMGLIADQRGVRIVEVQDEFGVDSKD